MLPCHKTSELFFHLHHQVWEQFLENLLYILIILPAPGYSLLEASISCTHLFCPYFTFYLRADSTWLTGKQGSIQLFHCPSNHVFIYTRATGVQNLKPIPEKISCPSNTPKNSTMAAALPAPMLIMVSSFLPSL